MAAPVANVTVSHATMVDSEYLARWECVARRSPPIKLRLFYMSGNFTLTKRDTYLLTTRYAVSSVHLNTLLLENLANTALGASTSYQRRAGPPGETVALTELASPCRCRDVDSASDRLCQGGSCFHVP